MLTRHLFQGPCNKQFIVDDAVSVRMSQMIIIDYLWAGPYLFQILHVHLDVFKNKTRESGYEKTCLQAPSFLLFNLPFSCSNS